MEHVREWNAYALAELAETASPDNRESPGARWLLRVRDAVVEASEDETMTADWDDYSHELADSLVPIYTHELMSVYVDLAAYQEDVSEYVSGEASEITGERLASIAMYEIGRRMIAAIVCEIGADA